MKRTLILMAAIGLSGAAGLAQESALTPVAEVGMTFSNLTTIPGAGQPTFQSQGGSGSFVYNLNHNLGIVGDLGGYHSGSDTNFSPTLFTYLFGPRLSIRRSTRFTPYVQALVGGARVSTNLLDPLTGNGIAQNGFAAAFGGGLDVRLTDRVAVKPFQIEYMMTQLPNIWGPNNTLNNIRVSAGLVFRFGSK